MYLVEWAKSAYAAIFKIYTHICIYMLGNKCYTKCIIQDEDQNKIKIIRVDNQNNSTINNESDWIYICSSVCHLRVIVGSSKILL